MISWLSWAQLNNSETFAGLVVHVVAGPHDDRQVRRVSIGESRRGVLDDEEGRAVGEPRLRLLLQQSAKDDQVRYKLRPLRREEVGAAPKGTAKAPSLVRKCEKY